jgi:hypothetical protein
VEDKVVSAVLQMLYSVAFHSETVWYLLNGFPSIEPHL